MPSVTFNQASNAVETGEVFLSLLEFTHKDLAEPIYFVDNTVAIQSNGITYLPYPFRLTMPDDKVGVLPTVQLSIDNVDRSLNELIRDLVNPPNVTLKIILASNPNAIEIQLDDLKLRNISFDAFTITGALIMDSPLGRNFPASTFNPKQYPSLFYR